MMMCARHIVLAHSTLSTLIVGANPHVVSIYSYQPLPPNIWIASCRATYLCAADAPREQLWTGSPEQQLELVVAGGYVFQPVPSPCLFLYFRLIGTNRYCSVLIRLRFNQWL